MKIFEKIRKENGRRHIYFLGIKVFSYIRERELKYCPFCKDKKYFLEYGMVTRKDAYCSSCKSLERHRFLYFIYNILFLNKPQNINILQIAPEKQIYDFLKNKGNINYTCIDLDPSLYPFAPDCKKMNALDLKFKENFFDVIIHNQVMEHIEEEQKFIDEQLRVLTDNGMIILNIPYNTELEKTYEDNSITSEEDRLKHYGQGDHVRLYGKNMLKNIENINIEKITEEFMTPKLIDDMMLKREVKNHPTYLEDAYFIIKKKGKNENI